MAIAPWKSPTSKGGAGKSFFDRTYLDRGGRTYRENHERIVMERHSQRVVWKTVCQPGVAVGVSAECLELNNYGEL